MDRYICIHGHFYQPPRENPWLETIELQDSAYPYHDWNERITAECYAPNAASRILDEQQRIQKIVNNYSRISFNFGPTLLSWMEKYAPETYRAILEADARSRTLYGGHGSALAQAYNHMILPLANRRDKRCQVLWGIRDFEHRFGREPEGMWLPETAVDVDTLEVLAEVGIRFTILAPHQARRVRPRDRRGWRDVGHARIDPSMAYEIRLPSRKTMGLFFYDGPVSRAVAFERLLESGETFANRLVSAFSDKRTWAQLVHIATDGETYGHHHRHGEMALSYAIDTIESGELGRLINYGAFLESQPPTHLAEIWENSSWSCAHGVERWRDDCGCNTGKPGWNQKWRRPLREALDWLRDRLAPHYERKAASYVRDPWTAREDYIAVILDRSPESTRRFLEHHALRPLSPHERETLWKLLELQRHAMLMYTSCGWFFDELSGIETVQVIQYAGRAVQLAREVLALDLEPEFIKRLSAAESNLAEHGDGRQIYLKFVQPAMIDLHKAAAHYAVSLLFEDYEARTRMYGYEFSREDYRVLEQGRARVALGRLRVSSVVTEETDLVSFGVLHFGDHNLMCGVRAFLGDDAYGAMLQEVEEAFSRAELPEVVRSLDKHFLELTYSLKSLFRDEQRAILTRILKAAIVNAREVYEQLYENHAAMMRFLGELGMPPPAAFRAAAEFVLDAGLRDAIEAEPIDLGGIDRLLRESRQEGIGIDRAGLGLALQRAIETDLQALAADPFDRARLERIAEAARFVADGTFEVNTWRIQNLYHAMLLHRYPEARRRTEHGDEDARAWVEHFTALGRALQFRID